MICAPRVQGAPATAQCVAAWLRKLDDPRLWRDVAGRDQSIALEEWQRGMVAALTDRPCLLRRLGDPHANSATFQLAGLCPANALDSATVSSTARHTCGAVCAINSHERMMLTALEFGA